MRMLKSRSALLLCMMAFSACAGRNAVPTATVQPHDSTSNCTMVSAEIEANQQRIAQLRSESTGTAVGNVALAVVGVAIFPPLLFAMDLKDAASTERESLNQRNSFLTRLASERCPGGVPLTSPSTPSTPAPPVGVAPGTLPAQASVTQPAPSAVPAQPAPASVAAAAATAAVQQPSPPAVSLEQYVANARADCVRQRRGNCDAAAEAAIRDYENAWQSSRTAQARGR